MEARYKQSAEQILKAFSVNPATGLSAATAQAYLDKYGENTLKEKDRPSTIALFLSQFKSYIIYILLFAIILSLLQSEFVDAIVILAILIANAVIGFVQEYKAEKAIDALKRLTGHSVTVLREGKKSLLQARHLVPGDIILLQEGNKTPADARVIQSMHLQVSEAALTGESVPVNKNIDVIEATKNLAEQKNMVFSGTLVTRGRASAVVTATGMRTEIGKIATVLNEVDTQRTPLQKKLDVLGKRIGIFVLILCLLVLITGLASDQLFLVLAEGNWSKFLSGASPWILLAVVLAVAAVPEGLPAIVTISLAIGVRNMARRNVIIRRLSSVETLGETTVICSDKTGTLTRNEMTVRTVFTNDKAFELPDERNTVRSSFSINGTEVQLDENESLLLLCGALCNDARLDLDGSIAGDPTEAALLVSARRGHISWFDEQQKKPRIDELPFDSLRKMMSTLHSKNGNYIQFTKGAPENILNACEYVLVDGNQLPLTTELRAKILDQNKAMAKQALRVLGFSYLERNESIIEECKLVFLGLQGMIDPPHKEVPRAIKTAIEAGIRVIMITGDNRFTAGAVAKEIGIVGSSIEGCDFAKMAEKEQLERLAEAAIFSRVEPGHKMLIVELLQKQGEIVAMTGDGVNDAPAIKKADIGIAMGKTGTDVAKESSDMILLDDDFTNIVHAIEEGRGIFANIRKFVNYLLSSNLGEVFVVFFALLLFGVEQLPLTAIMLLWLNLVTDGFPALALSVDPNPESLMKNTPGISSKYILNRYIVINMVVVSILITIGVLSVFYWSGLGGSELPHKQTMAFTLIILLELVRLQTIRQEYQLSFFSNKYLVAAVSTSIGLQLLVLYTPLARLFGTVALGLSDWIVLLLVSLIVWICNHNIGALMRRFT